MFGRTRNLLEFLMAELPGAAGGLIEAKHIYGPTAVLSEKDAAGAEIFAPAAVSCLLSQPVPGGAWGGGEAVADAAVSIFTRPEEGEDDLATLERLERLSYAVMRLMHLRGFESPGGGIRAASSELISNTTTKGAALPDVWERALTFNLRLTQQ